MAKGQPQSFNKNDITNDITLAIRQATQENVGAYNTNSMYVDVFQDSTGVTGLTNCEEILTSIWLQLQQQLVQLLQKLNFL